MMTVNRFGVQPIRDAITGKFMSVAEVARLAEVPGGKLHRAIKGHTPPDDRMRETLPRVLNTPLEWLFTRESLEHETVGTDVRRRGARRALTPAEHLTLGRELGRIRDVVIATAVEVSNRYGVSKPVSRSGMMLLDRLDKFRSQLDDQFAVDHPGSFCGDVYYPGDERSRTVHEEGGCTTCCPPSDARHREKNDDEPGRDHLAA